MSRLDSTRLRSLLARAWWPLVLCLAPLVVFHPIVFSGYTLSLAWPATRGGPTYGETDTCPVLDPGAASSQDESWLVLERRLMAAGELPLINMENGLGAPLLESLQPGAFYLLNPLLLLFDGDSPRMFDGFTLIHVGLFLVGLYVLARTYARPSIAAVGALAVGLTGVTYQHLDMVHYRSVTWLPWVLAAAIRIARGTSGPGTFVLLVLAHVAALTAGALQEVFVSSVATACVFALELSAVRASRGEVLARLARMGLAALSSCCIGAVAIYPYLKARALGDVFTAAGADRASQGLATDGMATLLVPHVNGFWPHMFRADFGTWITDFSTTGMFLVLIGLACAIHAREADGTPRRVALGVALVCALSLLKVQHVPWLDFLSRVPFVSEIRFVKYHYFVFVLFSILIVIGLEALARLDAHRRRRRLLVVVAVLVVLCTPIAWLFLTGRWTVPEDMPAAARAEARWTFYGSGAAFLATLGILWAAPRRAFAYLAIVLLALGVCVRPNGWLTRSTRFHTPAEALTALPVTEIAPARVVDENWNRGIYVRGSAGFFVQDAARIAALEPGSRLRFRRSGERRVRVIAGDQVWVEGPALDPEGDGAPNVIEVVDPKPVERARILSLLTPNTNVMSALESLWVFDPICNRRLRAFLAERFVLANPWFHLQCVYGEKRGFTSDQIDWFRFLGVTHLHDYKVASTEGLKPIGNDAYEVEGELPRVILLGREAALSIRDEYGHVPIAKTLADLRAAMAAQPVVSDVRVGARDVTFRVDRAFDGVVVATQAFAHGWGIEGRVPVPFCGIYPCWTARLEPGRDHRIAYEPPGLRAGAWIAAFGVLVAALGTVGFARRRSSA